MNTIEYLTRIKNLNEAEKMVHKERAHLMSEFIKGLDIMAWDMVFISATYKDRLETDKYLVNNVYLSFNGELVVFDLKSQNGDYHIYQVPIEKLEERVRLISRGPMRE